MRVRGKSKSRFWQQCSRLTTCWAFCAGFRQQSKQGLMLVGPFVEGLGSSLKSLILDGPPVEGLRSSFKKPNTCWAFCGEFGQQFKRLIFNIGSLPPSLHWPHLHGAFTVTQSTRQVCCQSRERTLSLKFSFCPEQAAGQLHSIWSNGRSISASILRHSSTLEACTLVSHFFLGFRFKLTVLPGLFPFHIW